MKEEIASIRLELNKLIDVLLEKVIFLDEDYKDCTKDELDELKVQFLENWVFNMHNGCTVDYCLDTIGETDDQLSEDIALLLVGLVELCQSEPSDEVEE